MNQDGIARYIRGVPDLLLALTSATSVLTDAPPTERVAVVRSRLNDESALVLELFLDLLVGILNVYSLKIVHLLRESTPIVDGTRRHFIESQDTVGHCDAVIILTKSRCLVNNACAISICDICVDDYAERFVLKLDAG